MLHSRGRSEVFPDYDVRIVYRPELLRKKRRDRER